MRVYKMTRIARELFLRIRNLSSCLFFRAKKEFLKRQTFENFVCSERRTRDTILLTTQKNKIIMSSILRASRRLLGSSLSSSNSSSALSGCGSRFAAVVGKGGERSIATTTKINAGMGSPTGTAPAPTEPLEEEHELIWDAGDKHPETALDNLPAKIVGKYEALGMLVGALCFMGGVYTFAGYYDKAASRPFVERDMEKSLKKELGGR
jgi:hypothetical protein